MILAEAVAGEEAEIGASLAAIRAVKEKLAAGVYPVEHVGCFCGALGGIIVREKDRYGFDHRMLCCEHCALIYASPRMTAEAYRDFYQAEYRTIYDYGTDAESEFQIAVEDGQKLKSYFDQFNIKPKVVWDLGCNSGGWLVPFQTHADTCGVDYDLSAIEHGKQRGLWLKVGGLEALEEQEQKADLIILSHFLEHALDLKDTLARVRALLSDSGHVFVAVPNLYRWDRDRLFQNAHTYQFTDKTLDYVMECSGFRKIIATGYIWSLWQKSDIARAASATVKDEVSKIVGHLENSKVKVRAPTESELQRLAPAGVQLRPLPIINCVNKFAPADRIKNIRAACGRNLHDLVELEFGEKDREAVIIGGGPSADDYVEKVRAFSDDDAYCVVAIERMLPWCLANRIQPEYVIALDASADVIDALRLLPTYVRYLVAMQCHPEVFERLRGKEVYTFQTPQRELEEGAHLERKGATLNSGGSITLGALAAAMLLGMKDFHIFGFDCHIGNGGYAKHIAGVGEQKDFVTVRVGGRDFKTTLPYLAFAQQFFALMQFGRDDGLWSSVKVYGDSMVSAMSRENIKGDGAPIN